MWVLSWANGCRPGDRRVTRRGCCAWSGCCGLLGVEVEDPGRQGDIEDLVQPSDLGAGRSGLAEQPGRAGEGAHVQALELVPGVGPGRSLIGGAGAGLDDPGQEQREPAENDVGADAVLEAVIDRAQVQDLLHVPPAAFDPQEPLVTPRKI